MANDVIQVNYEVLERIKQDFTRQAEESERMLQKIKSSSERLVGRQWEGEAARKFFHEMEDDVLPAFDRLSKALFGCQDVTAELAKEFRQAEEEAAALFKQDGGAGTTGAVGTSGASANTSGGASGFSGGSAGGGGGGGGGAGWGSVSSEDLDWMEWARKTAEDIPFIMDLPNEIDFGVNLILDDDFPSNISRAIAGEAGKFGFDMAAKGLAVGGLVWLTGLSAGTAVLVVGAGFLILKGVPVVLHLAAGAAQVSGNGQLAEKLDQWSEKIDYGRPIEERSEGLFDGITNTFNRAGSWLNQQAQDFVSNMQPRSPAFVPAL